MFKHPSLFRLAIVLAAVLVAQTASGQGSDYSTKKSAVLGGQEYSIDFEEAIDFNLVNPKCPEFPHLDEEKMDDWSHVPPYERGGGGWYYDEDGNQIIVEVISGPDLIRTLPAYDTEQLSSEIWKNFTNKEKRLFMTERLVLECFNTIDDNGIVREISRIYASPSDVAARISPKSYGRLIKTISQNVVYEDCGLMKYLGIHYFPGVYDAGNVMKIIIEDGNVKCKGFHPSIYEMVPYVLSSLLENPQYSFKHVDIQKLIEQKKKEKSHAHGGAQVAEIAVSLP